MEEINITILRKEDLDFTKKDIDINNVKDVIMRITNNGNNKKWLSRSTFIVFFDDNGDCEIVKNRYASNSEETNALLKFVISLNKKKY